MNIIFSMSNIPSASTQTTSRIPVSVSVAVNTLLLSCLTVLLPFVQVSRTSALFVFAALDYLKLCVRDPDTEYEFSDWYRNNSAKYDTDYYLEQLKLSKDRFKDQKELIVQIRKDTTLRDEINEAQKEMKKNLKELHHSNPSDSSEKSKSSNSAQKILGIKNSDSREQLAKTTSELIIGASKEVSYTILSQGVKKILQCCTIHPEEADGKTIRLKNGVFECNFKDPELDNASETSNLLRMPWVTHPCFYAGVMTKSRLCDNGTCTYINHLTFESVMENWDRLTCPGGTMCQHYPDECEATGQNFATPRNLAKVQSLVAMYETVILSLTKETSMTRDSQVNTRQPTEESTMQPAPNPAAIASTTEGSGTIIGAPITHRIGSSSAMDEIPISTTAALGNEAPQTHNTNEASTSATGNTDGPSIKLPETKRRKQEETE